MQVVEYRPELLPDLTRLINEQTAAIPPGCVFTERQVAHTVEQGSSLWDMHYRDDRELYDAKTLCVLHRRELVAAAQWQMPRRRRDVCPVSWIFAHPDHRNALRTLVHLLDKQAKTDGFSRVEMGRFSFGLGWFGIPSAWTHVIDAMQEAEFEHTETWSLMRGSTTVLKDPPLPASVKLYWDMNKPALEWKLTAYLGDTAIGECQVWGAPDHFEDCASFAEWASVEWIEVEGAHRKHGIAARMLAEQMRFHARRGILHFMTWARKDNEAARKLNESMGFEQVTDLLVLQKQLS